MSLSNVFRAGVCIGVVVLVALFVLTVGVPISKIRVTIHNLTDSDTPEEMRTIFANVYLDGELKTNITTQSGETSVVGSWQVKAGTHYVLVKYVHPDLPSDSPDASWSLYGNHYKLEAFDLKSVLIELE